MLRAKFFGAFNYRVGGCSETLNESSIIGRSVVGAFREPGGNRNWRYNDRANIRPEPTRILHPSISSPMRRQETTSYGPCARLRAELCFPGTSLACAGTAR